MKKQPETSTISGTKCYTYSIEMIVQVLAEDEITAKEKLDKEGGYVTNRETKLVDYVALFEGTTKEKK